MNKRSVLSLSALSPALLKSAAALAAPAPTPAYLAEELGQIGASPLGQPAATPSLLPTLLNVTFSLAFVIGLVYLAYWLLLKWRNRQGLSTAADKVGLINVLEKHYIDASHSLAVVEMGEEILYLGLAGEVTLLSKVSDPETVERLRSQAPLPASFMGFQEQLSRVGARLKQEEWTSTKKSLRTQADDLKQQIERLRGKKRGQDE
jgi:flagellar biogenesis protein FliO